MVVLALLAALQGRPAPALLPDVVEGPLAARMDSLVSRAAVFGFSGQVLVQRDGRVILHRAYGFADRARRIPMTTTTRIGLASMSKQVAAAVIQALAAAGRLSLDASITRYLGQVPPDKRAITVRQVVSHTAGLAGGFADDFEDVSLTAIASRVLAAPLRWAPGSRWGYSTEGYAVLALIAEQAAGKPWDQLLHEMVFTPAAMEHSGTWRDRWAEGDVAHAYQGWRDNGSPATWPVNWRVAGGGDVVSTVGDLLRLDQALAAGRLMPAQSVSEYLRPLARIDSTMEYGFGLFHWRTPYGDGTVEHGGDTDLGYNGAFSRYPERRALLLVLTNGRDWFGRSTRAAVQAELEAMLLGARPDTVALAPLATPLSAEERQALTGTWAYPGGDRLHLVDDGAILWAAAEGQGPVNLLTNRAGDQASGLATATRRTGAFLAAALRQDSAGMVTAIADTAQVRQAEILAEIARLRERYGVMREARVLGSIVRPGAALTTVAVTSARHDTYRIAFRWGAGGTGGLTAIFDGEPWPVILPVAHDASGALLPYDMVSGRAGQPIRLEGNGPGQRLLLPDGTALVRAGLHGWRPGP